MSSRDTSRTITTQPNRARVEASFSLHVTVVDSADTDQIGTSTRLDGRLTVGRDGQLSLLDPALSRQHVSLARHKDGVTVTDLDSKNGTWVDGAELNGGRAFALPTVVRAGDSVLVVERWPPAPPRVPDAHEMLGNHPLHLQSLANVRTVAPSPLTALITGETGTGKELAAALIHKWSKRSGQFVAVNCAAIPENLIESTLFGHKKGAFTGATGDSDGVFRAADRGTLFLDEVGELSLIAQAKLLRTLEVGTITPVGASRDVKVQVRVIAATHRDLKADVEAGRFRMDLYARLRAFPVRLPPLRDRLSDVVPMFRHFLGRSGPVPEADAVERLLLHSWPMNVRELKALAERMKLMCAGRGIALKDLPEEFLGPAPDSSSTSAAAAPSVAGTPDIDELRDLLVAHHGNIGRIAKALNKDRTQVYRWLKKYDLDAAQFRP